MKPLKPYIRPFLKWPGGKFRTLKHIHPVLPSGKRLVEPFVGSGALFLNSDYQRYFLNDINPDLINLFNTLKTQPDEFIRRARYYFASRFNTKEEYYRLRRVFNVERDAFKRSLLFLYLNRHAYNGLCRYNRRGEFNVPFGQYKKPYFPAVELQHFAAKAQRASFSCLPFEKFLQQIRLGDVVYCDPPYVPLSKTANFTAYSQQGFSLAEQEKLAECAKVLSAKKIPVLISNHDTDFTRALYQGAELNYFPVRRLISCQSETRGQVQELLAVYS